MLMYINTYFTQNCDHMMEAKHAQNVKHLNTSVYRICCNKRPGGVNFFQTESVLGGQAMFSSVKALMRATVRQMTRTTPQIHRL